jgi:hypothetical protein
MLERIKKVDFLGVRLRTLPLARRKPRFVRYIGRVCLSGSAMGLFLVLRDGATGQVWQEAACVLSLLCLAAISVSMLAAVRYAEETRELKKALADLDSMEDLTHNEAT